MRTLNAGFWIEKVLVFREWKGKKKRGDEREEGDWEVEKGCSRERG